MSESNLPTEILQDIFALIALSKHKQEARSALRQSLFVSKRWNTLAMTEYYKTVRLTADQIAAFALTLSTSDLGYLVQNIEFYPIASPCPQNYYQFPNDVDKDIDTILQHVPNLERISSPWSAFETDHILKRLQVPELQLKYLKYLPFSERMNSQERNVYADHALKFKNSLTKLSLIPNSRSADFISLKDGLKGFKSLEQLQLCGSSVEGSIVAEVDDLISECHETTRVLKLERCNLSSNRRHTVQLNPNNSIKTLQLNDSTNMLSASTIQYFANKLIALETLVINARYAVNPPLRSEEDCLLDWWNQMTNLCQRLQSFNISSCTLTLDQITHWANVIKTIANQEGSTIELCINLGNTIMTNTYHIIRLKQRNPCVHLVHFMRDNISTEFLDKILQRNSTNVIRILNVEEKLYCKIVVQKYAPEMKPEASLLNTAFRSKSWEVFHIVVASLTKNKPETVVHLDRMILPGPKYTGNDVSEQVSSIISELKFTNSLIHSNAFPRMSLKLLKIDTLILDECFFVSSSPHRLEIHLPDTELGHLKLNLSRMLRLGSFGCRTVVVKASTETATYQYIKDEDFKTDQKITDTIGSKDNFLIYIVCKELQSWVVTGMKPEEEWKQQKVEAAPIIKSLE